MNAPDLLHGSESAYARHGCRCDKCRHGRFLRVKRYKANRHRNGDMLVDAGPAKEHLARLEAEGFGRVSILNLIGWGGNGRTIAPLRRVHRRYAAAIRALNRDRLLAEFPDGAWVPAVGAVRRVRALQALGWPLPEITPGSVAARNTVKKGKRWITAGTHRLIASRFEQLCMTPGPSDSARRRSNGVTPLMWDDIDDPAAKPWREPRYGARSVVDADDLEHFLDGGMNIDAIAARLGVGYESIYRQLTRTGHHELRERLIQSRRTA